MPLAFDTAVNIRAAHIKGLLSPVTGLADILTIPDLERGNMLAKQLEYLGGAQLAGIILGARSNDPHQPRRFGIHPLTSCAVAVLLHYAEHPLGMVPVLLRFSVVQCGKSVTRMRKCCGKHITKAYTLVVFEVFKVASACSMLGG
jgi:hypothetical protein